jgi:hypothetical protein
VKLNQELPWKSNMRQEEDFHQQTGLKLRKKQWSATFDA